MPNPIKSKDRSCTIKRPDMRFDTNTPICAPIIAPNPPQNAANQSTFPLKIWIPTPNEEYRHKANTEVAVARCGTTL